MELGGLKLSVRCKEHQEDMVEKAVAMTNYVGDVYWDEPLECGLGWLCFSHETDIKRFKDNYLEQTKG